MADIAETRNTINGVPLSENQQWIAEALNSICDVVLDNDRRAQDAFAGMADLIETIVKKAVPKMMSRIRVLERRVAELEFREGAE